MEKKLGLGCMRLPLTEPGNPAAIDGKEVARMVAAALERGFTYFDTAWTYHDGASEEALRRTLVERYPREAYRLTDKLPTMLVEHAEQQERIFDEQLRRCGVEWFDGYLVHCATAAFCERAERLGSFDFALRKREEGRIRRVGFSYHDSPELLDELLTRHPEVDFVQLQISYVDWEGTPIRSRRCHEIARRHGKPIVVMCPLKGGMLASVPPRVERMFRERRPEASPASWALRFAASLEGVETVLSGMSSMDELLRNAAFMEHFEPFDRAEYALVERAADLVLEAQPVQCTQCGYCEPVCPERIPIRACQSATANPRCIGRCTGVFRVRPRGLRRPDQRAAGPHERQAQQEAQAHVEGEEEPVFLLQQQVHVVGEGGESGEAAAESRDEQHVHRGRDQVGLFRHAEEDADDEAADDVHREGAPREWRVAQMLGQLARQEAQAGADEAAAARNDHSFEHGSVLVEWLITAPGVPNTVPELSHGGSGTGFDTRSP